MMVVVVLLKSNMQETGLTSQLLLHTAHSTGPRAWGHVVMENPHRIPQGPVEHLFQSTTHVPTVFLTLSEYSCTD